MSWFSPIRGSCRCSAPRADVGRAAVRLAAAAAMSWIALEALSAAPVHALQSEPPADLPTEQLIRRAGELFDQIDALDEGEERKTVMDEATGLVRKLAAKEPNNPWLSQLRGRALMAAGRHRDAVDELTEFAKTREGRSDWRSHVLLADLLVEEFPRLAESNYEKARALKPDEPSTLHGLSVCAAKTGKLDEAVKLAYESVGLDGRRTPKYVAQLANALVAAKRWSEAEHEALTALDLAQVALRNQPGVRAAVSAVYEQYGTLLEIVKAKLSQPGAAGGSSPDDFIKLADFIRGRAEAAAMLSTYDQLGALEAGVRRFSPNVPVRLAEKHAIALADVNRIDAAIVAFENILKGDPQNATAAEWLTRLKDGSRAAPTGRP